MKTVEWIAFFFILAVLTQGIQLIVTLSSIDYLQIVTQLVR